jgi:hypothetical protein
MNDYERLAENLEAICYELEGVSVDDSDVAVLLDSAIEKVRQARNLVEARV